MIDVIETQRRWGEGRGPLTVHRRKLTRENQKLASRVRLLNWLKLLAKQVTRLSSI